DHGYMYEVLLGDEIICTHIDPEFASCRELLKRGVTGKAHFKREGRAQIDMICDIERAAKYCTQEGERVGPRFRKYVEFGNTNNEDENEELLQDSRAVPVPETIAA
ncbi:MAG: hypothetical protein WBX25_36120, partial [Rhodomicrobium sp.]